MKKPMCLLLVLCTLFPACGCTADVNDSVKPPPKEFDSSVISDSGDPTSSLPSETAVYYEPDNLPEGLDFGGERFTVLTVGDDRFKYE